MKRRQEASRPHHLYDHGHFDEQQSLANVTKPPLETGGEPRYVARSAVEGKQPAPSHKASQRFILTATEGEVSLTMDITYTLIL
jgi:hypothetical protein